MRRRPQRKYSRAQAQRDEARIAEILREYWHRRGFEAAVDLSEEVFRTEGGARRGVGVLRSNLVGGLPRRASAQWGENGWRTLWPMVSPKFDHFGPKFAFLSHAPALAPSGQKG